MAIRTCSAIVVSLPFASFLATHVNPTLETHPVSLPWYTRVALVGIAMGLAAALAVAVYLRPSERGFGTHQQLGLPPCAFRVWFGLRCPSCGMTTAWSHMVHGHPIRAVLANAGGAASCATALVCVPWLLVSGARGRWIFRPPGELTLAVAATAFVAVTLLDWALRLWFA
jgi:hypothetical protein